MVWAPTTEQILNLDGVRRRSDQFRFDLLDQTGAVIGALHPDRERPPVVSNDTTRTVPRSLSSFHLPADETRDINPVTDRVQAWMRLQNGVEFSLGVFLWGDASQPVRGWGEEHSSSLVDRTMILNQPFTGSHGWPAGARTDLIILFLVFQAGFTLEDIGGSGDVATLSEPVAWPPGTTYTRALTDVGEQIGIAAPWADRHGLLHFEEPPDPTAGDVTAQIPPYGPGTRIIVDSIVRSDDLLAAPNYFFVYDTGIKTSRTGSYSLPASAPHSEANRGFRVAMVEGMQGLASTAQADKAARALSRTKGLAFDWINWSSTADPRHDTWDLVQVEGDTFLETGWSLTCRSGAPMRHTARRAY